MHECLKEELKVLRFYKLEGLSVKTFAVYGMPLAKCFMVNGCHKKSM